MKDMVTAETPDCPFQFNFDAATFKVGDYVSYRVPGRFGEMPFVGILSEVAEDYVRININDLRDPDHTVRGTRENRPVVDVSEVKF